MRSAHIISTLLIGACVAAPLAVFAEGTATTGAPYKEPNPRMQQRGEMGVRIATGTRMMASGTRPLPVRVEERIEQREERNTELRDCLSENGGTASRTDCMTKAREERQTQAKERIAERRGEALRAMTTLLGKRLEAGIERITKLADRVDSRIAKLKLQGVVTTEAEANIAIVRTKLTEAQSALLLVQTKTAAALAADTSSSTSRGDLLKEVRDAMTVAREALVQSHKALVEALKSLKANVKATTTPEVAN